MTAINIIRKAETVHIISDGVFYGPDGVVRQIGPKVFTFPYLSAAVGFRGARSFINAFNSELLNSRISSFEALKYCAPMLAGSAHVAAIASMLAQGDTTDREAEVFIAGWCGTSGKMESFVVPTHDRHAATAGFEHVKAFALSELPPAALVPAPDPEHMRAVGWIDPDSIESFDEVRDGAKLLEAQRLFVGAMDARDPNGFQGHGVGGFGQLTTVTRWGTASSILMRWPDQIGHRIEVSRGAKK